MPIGIAPPGRRGSGVSIIEDLKNKEVFAAIENLEKDIGGDLRHALRSIGAENVRHLRKMIVSPPHTGNIYNRPGNLGSRHQASAPGEAPAEQTGNLRRSVSYRVHNSRRMEFGENIFYGRFLEDGTRRMAPRPHVIRTVRERDIFNYKIIERATRRTITGK